MTTTLACTQCGTVLNDIDTPIPVACPQCGAALPITATPEQAPPVITPVHDAMVPPPPAIMPGINMGVQLPYGELQHAATYLGMARTLRGIGIGNIVYGAFLAILGCIFAGIAISDGGADAVVGIVMGIIFFIPGLILIGEGIWLVSAPSAAGLLVAAISMFATAVLFARGIIVMVVLIFYGVALIKRYKKYGPMMAERPSPEMLSQAGTLLDKLQKAARKKSPELIEFSSSDALARKLWRGLPQENLLVLIAMEKRLFGQAIADVYFLSPYEVTIETSGKEFIGKWLKGTLHINEQKIKGTIPPECLQRFQAWQQQYTAH